MIRTGTMAKRKRSEHYVNNKEFLAALIRYREDVEIAKIQDKQNLSSLDTLETVF